MRVLILGGTTEARSLCAAIAGYSEIDAVLSLAGRTKTPAPQAVKTRIGGFGGVEGLKAYLRDERIGRVIDATHPFAARMSRHAAAACAALQVPLLIYTRPPWLPQQGDDWIAAADNLAAIRALGSAPRRVFLALGRLGLPDFAIAPQHAYVIRAIDDPGDLSYLPRHELVLDRGPFSFEDEKNLLRERRIERLISKNSGGAATEAKFAAARALAIPVIMIARPAAVGGSFTHDANEALAFLRRGIHAAGAERGV